MASLNLTRYYPLWQSPFLFNRYEEISLSVCFWYAAECCSKVYWFFIRRVVSMPPLSSEQSLALYLYLVVCSTLSWITINNYTLVRQEFLVFLMKTFRFKFPLTNYWIIEKKFFYLFWNDPKIHKFDSGYLI